ncbi:hypothetical protein JK359_14310 [Streptomyces actinomycinicus]|uniref:Uncharacterized protein n=1 Tax=Streptomyces actinomycinicus TaxID=1695166 RepID=A0A937EIZ7_9ACTN|nr:hypothetical protein [Streptomyces actinomycinicus]MBL1083145.1 hypothetical protein [Streptomyces actinomycinicus]
MPGTVLLLAASPLGRGRLVDAAGVLPVLAAVAPAVLSGTDTANVVELADPLEPQAVLTRLRAAAAAPGPLTVYVTGQLNLDRRQHRPHLALARTTPATVRYTALPWHWIREELRLRSAADTALVVDLHADAEAFRYVTERGLDSGRNTSVHGRIAPAAGRRGPAGPAYMKTVATLLRSGQRPPLHVLHQQAVARIPEETTGNLLLASTGGAPAAFPGPVVSPGPALSPGSPGPNPPAFAPGTVASVPVPVPVSVPMPVPAPLPGAEVVPGAVGPGSAPRPEDPHAAISAAVQGGRHGEADGLAARYEEAAVRAHGAGSEEALHWSEVRADLAMFAGDPARSCRAWLGVAGARLAAGQPVDAPAVEAAVDRAHHQWARIKDLARARELGPALAELRLRVPGRRRGALENVQRQLGRLQATR